MLSYVVVTCCGYLLSLFMWLLVAVVSCCRYLLSFLAVVICCRIPKADLSPLTIKVGWRYYVCRAMLLCAGVPVVCVVCCWFWGVRV